ncbi:hypothetical protein ACLKA7_008500 [Drosophila subpalustris]
MKGQLLSTARPYLQLLSLLSLTAPPCSYERNPRSRQWKLMMLIFSCYTCCITLLTAYVSYGSILILQVELKEAMVEDFSYALGLAQKILLLILQGAYSVNMLIYYQKLGRIYWEISSLELDIDAAFQMFGNQRKRTKFRVYLFTHIGLWTIFMLSVFPRLTFPLMTDFMIWHNKVLSVFVLLVVQFKSLEYTLFVILIRELLLRLRHNFIQLQQELTVCEQHDLLQALVQAIRKNKNLHARIWKLVGEVEGYFMLPMLMLFLYNLVCMLHVYNSFGRILHNIRGGSGLVTPQLLKMILMEFALQMEHLKLRFTCGGFFDINLKYFASIVVTLISYVVILIQFKLQGMHEAKQAATQRIS